jgi:hypothetical protein
MNIQNEIIKTIELIVQKTVENQQNLDVSSVVIGTKGDKAKVIVDGVEYWVDNTLGLEVGDGVWMHIPNSRKNMNQMYMSNTKTKAISGGGSGGGGGDIDLSNYFSKDDAMTRDEIIEMFNKNP